MPLYETTPSHYLVSIAIATGLAIGLTALLVHFVYPHNAFDVNRISLGVIVQGALNTLARMVLAFILSVAVAVPLALFIGSTPRIQTIFLPIADILQSVPVLAFFPVVAVFFVANNAFELAAVFFRVRGWRRFWFITLPSLFPFLVTGSLLAWAQGWTIVIVAEVLHAYIPKGNPSQDLLGLGSLLVDSNAQVKNGVFLASLTAMILVVTLMNFAVWQPLLRLSQRFRFD